MRPAGAALSNAGAAPPATGGAVAATAKTVVADSLKVNALALQKPAAAAVSADVGRASAGGRGGGRAAPGARQMAGANVREQMASPSASAQIIDPRLSGCWLVIDSVPSRVFVLNFIDPIVTDAQRAAAKPFVERGTVGGMAAPRELTQPPAGARVEHTTPRMIGADSSFSAEWVTGNERTTMLFTVRGDTLAGTTRRAAGDIAYPVVPVRAVRAQCPP
jgi:hypothetical protein